MAKIYISYSTHDTDVAQQIAAGLKILGHQINIDIETLTAGQEWRSVLSDALKSSEVFISLLTKNSVSSQYVLTELGTARAFAGTSKKMLLIPIVFGDIGIPDVIRDIHVLFSRDHSIDELVMQIDLAINAFIGKRVAEKEQEVEVKRRIEANAATYIDEALKSLREHESKHRRIGNVWYYLGFVTLVSGVAFGFYSVTKFANSADQQWIRFGYLGLKSIIIVGLLIACSKYAFTLGKSYMSEALKSADRVHAISFGKFYLRAFSEKADWVELKEVFQHWNIDKASAFSNLDGNQFDPKFLDALVEVAKAISSKAELKK
jgi:hypothetical protein